MKKHKDIDIYDFSDYAEEVTGDALFKINGGAEVENSHEGVAGANVGDTLTRKDGTVVVINQGDIDYAKRQLGVDENSSAPNENTQPTVTGVPDGYNYSGEYGSENQISNLEVPEEIKLNSNAYAYYMALQQRAKEEGNPDKYKNYNVLGGKQCDSNEVYFIYVYKTYSEFDQNLKAFERSSINEEIKYLQQNGVSVKVIESGSYNDIKNALEDKKIKLLITSGHGYEDGAIQTSNGGVFSPSNLKTINVSESLKTVIFENCYQSGKNLFSNDNEQKWEEAFGGNVDVIGWKWQTSKYETTRFNNFGLFDRQLHNLMYYCKEVVNDKN